MAIVVRNTNYNGEVLEKILVLACTGNDLVEKGLIMVIPGVEKKISLPRIKTGKMLQKRKENPGLEDSKGNFNYSEKSLDPEDFMAFTTFNPRAFEHIWRKWQPKGNLVFAELPPEAQNTLLDELSKSVKFELGWHYINGEFGSDDDHLFNGILTQAAKDSDVIVVPAPADTSMIGKLKAVRKAIPKALRENPNLRILMSIDVNLQDDEEVIQIDKWMNSSELYFFKLLMKADTEIAFGEEFVVLDTRTDPVFKAVEHNISADPSALSFKAAGESKYVTVTASGDYSVTSVPAGFTAVGTDDGLKITAEVNSSGKAVSGTLVVSLDADPGKKVEIALSQVAADDEEGGA